MTELNNVLWTTSNNITVNISQKPLCEGLRKLCNNKETHVVSALA